MDKFDPQSLIRTDVPDSWVCHVEVTKEELLLDCGPITMSPLMKQGISETMTGIAKTATHAESISRAVQDQWDNEDQTNRINSISKSQSKLWDNEEYRINQSKKIGASIKGIPHNRTECVHCGKQGGKPGITRYHNDNCKQKDIYV